jgi:hypothetical protein
LLLRRFYGGSSRGYSLNHHDVAIIDGGGKLVAKKRISDDPAGFSALTEMLAAAGDCPEDLIPIAIETPRGLLVAALRATGRRCSRSTRWLRPATGNGTRWPARSLTTPMR